MNAQQIAFPIPRDTVPVIEYAEPKGIVYTKPWVVNLILDFVGYTSDRDLSRMRAVEPAAGEGAFLIPMAIRLLESARQHGLSIDSLAPALAAYELSELSAQRLASRVVSSLTDLGADAELARRLADHWIRVDDYLLAAPYEEAVDYVIGNPPYIRYDDLSEGALRVYRSLYATMRGRGDIYVGFLEAGLKQLAPGGVCGFICADRWMLNAYGAELRTFVSSHFAVDAIVQMHDAPAFENDVSAYPAVVILRRGCAQPTLVAEAGVDVPVGSANLAQSIRGSAEGPVPTVKGIRAGYVDDWFRGPAPWALTTPKRIALLRELEERFGRLEDDVTGTKVGIGVATGADDIFITKDSELVERDRLLPLALGGDIRTGELRWSGHLLVDPWGPEGLVDLRDYPRLNQYLERHATQLRRRHVAKDNHHSWYRTIDRVTHSLMYEPKLLFQDMKLRIHPVLDRGHTYPHHNLYWVTSNSWDLEILGGLLLSRVAQFFIESYCVKMRGGTLRFQAQYLRRIRVPNPDLMPETIKAELQAAFAERDEPRATHAALRAYGISAIPASADGS